MSKGILFLLTILLSVSGVAHTDSSLAGSALHHWFEWHHGAMGFVCLVVIAGIFVFKKRLLKK